MLIISLLKSSLLFYFLLTQKQFFSWVSARRIRYQHFFRLAWARLRMANACAQRGCLNGRRIFGRRYAHTFGGYIMVVHTPVCVVCAFLTAQPQPQPQPVCLSTLMWKEIEEGSLAG